MILMHSFSFSLSLPHHPISSSFAVTLSNKVNKCPKLNNILRGWCYHNMVLNLCSQARQPKMKCWVNSGLFLICLPVGVLGKAAESCPSVWVLASWFQPGPALDEVTIPAFKQQMVNGPFSHSVLCPMPRLTSPPPQKSL